MERKGDEIHVETDEARAASTPNVVRWVLATSLLAAIVLLSAIWIFGALTADDGPPAAAASVAASPASGRGGDED